MDPNKIRKLRAYCDALLKTRSVADESEPEQPEKPDLDAWRTSVRNRILAGSGDKAALLGTLSTEPTVTAADLRDAGLLSTTAAELIAERDQVRAIALQRDSEIGAAAVEAEPVPKVR